MCTSRRNICNALPREYDCTPARIRYLQEHSAGTSFSRSARRGLYKARGVMTTRSAAGHVGRRSPDVLNPSAPTIDIGRPITRVRRAAEEDTKRVGYGSWRRPILSAAARSCTRSGRVVHFSDSRNPGHHPLSSAETHGRLSRRCGAGDAILSVMEHAHHRRRPLCKALALPLPQQ